MEYDGSLTTQSLRQAKADQVQAVQIGSHLGTIPDTCISLRETLDVAPSTGQIGCKWGVQAVKFRVSLESVAFVL